MSSVHKEKIGKYIIKIYPDSDPCSPREDDNLGTMVCFHNRYSLGDDHNFKSENYNSWDEMEKDIIKTEKVGVILPLYLYDHSGIRISTGQFSCRWDSGQIGFIFISKKKMLEEYGGKIVTKKLKERVTRYLNGEVEVYDQYLQGDIYGYKIFIKEKGEEKEEIDSCWGFYGMDECLDEAKGIVDSRIEDEKPEENEVYYTV